MTSVLGCGESRRSSLEELLFEAGPRLLCTTNYLYDGLNDIEEVDNAGTALTRYTQTILIDEPLTEQRSSTTTYYEPDGKNSVTSMTTTTGTIAGSYAYDTFGNLSTSTGSVTNSYRYTAREFDPETGIYFYRARYYDTESARFLSEDPIGFRGGINSYRYASNNPALLGDPLGLCPPRKRNCDAAFPKDPTTARFVQLVFAEGNGSDVGDAAVASTVVNRANYGNSREFGRGIGGVINRGYQATGNPLFNRVSNANKVRNLDPDNCQRYKNALMAVIAAQQPGGTNTNALFYFDISIDLPTYIKNGLQDGSIVPTTVDGQTGQSSNYIEGPYGNPQVFFGYSDYSH